MADTVTKTVKTQIRKLLSDGTYQVEHPETIAEQVIGLPKPYVHPTSAGYKHIPSGGSAGQFLAYAGSSGTARWEDVQLVKYLYNYDSGYIRYVNFAKGDTSSGGTADEDRNPMRISANHYNNATIVTDNKIDVTGYNSIVVTIERYYGASSDDVADIRVVIDGNKNGPSNIYYKGVTMTVGNKAQISLPIDGVNGSYYIRIHGTSSRIGNQCNHEITEIKLLK